MGERSKVALSAAAPPTSRMTMHWHNACVPRPLTPRERDVLDALLSVDFEGVEVFRLEAEHVLVIGGCGCGCPSVDFYNEAGTGMYVRVHAAAGNFDGLFLYTVAGRLGGIEWVGTSSAGPPAEFPPLATLIITPA